MNLFIFLLGGELEEKWRRKIKVIFWHPHLKIFSCFLILIVMLPLIIFQKNL